MIMTNEMIRFRYRLRLVGMFLAMFAFLLTSLSIVTPITISGGFYLLGYWLIVAGLILAPRYFKYHLVLITGMIVIVLVAIVRISYVNDKNSVIKIIELPSNKKTRWLNFLIDEQDSVLFGEAALRFVGVVTEREHDNIVSALSASYKKLRTIQHVFPSSVINTYLGFQKPTAFDTIVIEPSVTPPAPIAVVFLHGSMGNVTIQCWQIAQAVSKIGATTICPSTNWLGEWWLPEGEATIRATLNYVQKRGIEQLYLGGYSNGGNGIGSLISTLANEHELKGLFFIAGINNPAKIRATQRPVLVIQGIYDQKIPVEKVRRTTEEIGNLATYVELQADHFLIMKQTQLVQEAINTWLEKLVEPN